MTNAKGGHVNKFAENGRLESDTDIAWCLRLRPSTFPTRIPHVQFSEQIDEVYNGRRFRLENGAQTHEMQPTAHAAPVLRAFIRRKLYQLQFA